MADAFDFNQLGLPSDPTTHSSPLPPPATTLTAPTPTHHADDTTHTARHGGGVTVYQTTGPDAHTGPILAPGGSGMPALNPRSCVTCRRRKVRCDKQMPCSNCRRAQIPCVFPAPGRAPRQPRPKDPNAPPKTTSQREVELVKRLKKLEGIVEELSGQIEVEGGKSAGASPEALYPGQHPSTLRKPSMDYTGPSPNSDSTSDQGMGKKDVQQQFGRLVLNDHKGSTIYVSSGFWSKLNDELHSIRKETRKLTPDGESDSEDDSTPYTSPGPNPWPAKDHHDFILGYRSSDVDLKGCHPLPAHAPYLWSVYLENVDPLVKILHVPSTEGLIHQAKTEPGTLSPADEALVFSIYYAAIISLEADEVMAKLGTDRDDLLRQYRFASEQSLAKANYLNTSDLTVLTAFTIFLKVVRRHDDTRFCWSLTGLLVRIAQGMGLHRDGTYFNLTPFETEMRRRVWWVIMTIDVRSSEEMGSDMAIPDGSFDTEMPSNVNDADISPESTVLPEPKDGRSDSALALVRYEITLLTRRFHVAASSMTAETPILGTSTISEREQVLVDIYQRIERKFLKYVGDVSDPLNWMAALISRVIMAKMRLVIYQPVIFPGSNQHMSEDIRDRVFAAAIEIIEFNHRLNTDSRCKNYRWLFLSYTNWPAIAYLLIEICRRPWSALVERSWEAVHGYDRDPTEIARNTDHIAVFLPLHMLFVRARKHRTAEIARLKANPEEARRLDGTERVKPPQSRFDPIPDSETTMEYFRQKWRSLVQQEGASPWTKATLTPANSDYESLRASASPFQAPHVQQHALQQQPQHNVSQQIPPVDYAGVNLEYLGGALAQPAVVMSDFWSMPAANTKPAPAFAVNNAPGFNQAPDSQTAQNFINDEVLRQKAYMLPSQPSQQPPKDDHVPPYLWPDSFTAMGDDLDNGAAEDMDMLGDGFNWQDWSQNIRGLEMDNTQGQWRW
ncbi:hypothetical protein S40285_01095 [Stachybotrys chlorohalonatus IBT 40285]|uniref:Zn(2)-C6 fungal-type domain-containing protein n=1 Tax=Stachybotrys chlorohalonatus (strain IBT 40285) TaxID=1283841 RepID=A0A084QKG9_STAC4|nr:hypothetical protein S40285_01095 [Stachybotrys chlorohalonata IBT 40285]